MRRGRALARRRARAPDGLRRGRPRGEAAGARTRAACAREDRARGIQATALDRVRERAAEDVDRQDPALQAEGPMKLTHTATVPAPVERVWAVVMDVPTAAKCVPGVTGV